jgi:hypothetical protein
MTTPVPLMDCKPYLKFSKNSLYFEIIVCLACKSGSTPALGSCYTIIKEAQPFPQAQVQCRALGADLLEIESQLENTGHFP